MRREPLKDRALGKWPGILSALGVPAKVLNGRHQPCPFPGCGGKDRFRFDDKGGRGTFFCSQCKAGDGIEFVKLYFGVEFKEAAQMIERHIGAAPVIAVKGKQRASDEQQREEMRALWDRAKPIEEMDAAGRYLQRRLGRVMLPDNLRFSPDERYAAPGAKPTWHPMMVAKVQPSDEAKEQGQLSALHRTYLDDFGNKADVSSPRKMLGSMPTGAAVRLMAHGEVLGIAEGIETALAASILHDVPAWAALTAGLLQDWTPPANVQTVFVFGDNDVSFAGQAAAYTLAARLKVRGLSVFVELPPRMGTDWNDVLDARQRGAA